MDNKNGNTVVIGIAAMDIVKAPDRIVTYGLGSCVGVTLYDRINKIAGMVHIMLPNSSGNETGSARFKFADTGVEDLIVAMIKNGANRRVLTAKIAGGAHMFRKTIDNDLIKVGERNITVVRETLKKNQINIEIDDTGGTYARTIEMSAETGQLFIRSIGHGQKIL